MRPLIQRRAGRSSPRPPDWARAFGRRLPLEVDLGCGRGSYLLERARSRPEVGLVGIETRAKWIAAIRAAARREGLTNLRAIRCDAQHDLPLLFAAGSVRGFSLHHPDPWWKKRHRKRRLVQAEFVDLLARLLEPGGWVFVQTDVPDLAGEIRASFLAHAAFCELDAEALLRDRLDGLQSHRGHKCRRLGIPIQRLAFGRRG